MATKKKRRHPGQARTTRGPGSKPTGTAGAGSKREFATTTGAAAVKVRPAEPGGPNRQARKEEARRQREAVRRRQARRRYYRIGAAVLAVLVATAAVIFLVQNNRKKTTRALAAAQCGAVQTISPFNATDDQAHIGASGSGPTSPPPLSGYPSNPPTSGPHDGTPWTSGVSPDPPNIYQAIHSLEHGAVIIWYSPTAPASDIAKVTAFYQSTSENDHVIVAPYNYPDQGDAGQLPAGKQMAMVAWHHLQTCGKVSLDAAKSFVSSFRVGTGSSGGVGYKGDAPEAGRAI